MPLFDCIICHTTHTDRKLRILHAIPDSVPEKFGIPRNINFSDRISQFPHEIPNFSHFCDYCVPYTWFIVCNLIRAAEIEHTWWRATTNQSIYLFSALCPFLLIMNVELLLKNKRQHWLLYTKYIILSSNNIYICISYLKSIFLGLHFSHGKKECCLFCFVNVLFVNKGEKKHFIDMSISIHNKFSFNFQFRKKIYLASIPYTKCSNF